jgi:hypothetical protein
MNRLSNNGNNNVSNNVSNNENLFESEIDPVLVQKMVFVYNALNDGWTVKKKGHNNYLFTMNTEEDNVSDEIKREINLDDYLRKFLRFNMNIENLTKPGRSGSN